ncbi:hypothetical protein [Bosea sp. AAP35]|uniref:hypothetical protein n=1 Tax=Bosea sp. AAP35 TaxID=1523417 RepID=UPI000A42E009|nr:hypothetical protein [Bosea sp. AAP35]
MTRKIINPLCAAVALASLVYASAQAEETTRLDVQVLVNRAARDRISNADDHLLTIETLKIPRVATETGRVCGAIVSLRRKPEFNQWNSYAAILYIENGRVTITGMATFFMPVEELMGESSCR